MKKIFISILFVLCSVFCFAEEVSFSLGEQIANPVKFCEDADFLRAPRIYAIIPYEDGYLIKLATDSSNNCFELFAKVGTAIYFNGYGTEVIKMEIVKLSPNTVTFKY